MATRQTVFPGVDPAGYDDFGVSPNEVTIDGLIVGDDYIAQGQALIAAFNTPGPATLVHPWLGPMTVILVEPGEVQFSDRELRVVRFNVTFKRIDAGGFSLGLGSLSGLTSAIEMVVSAASALCLAAGRKVISATRQKASARSHRIVSTAVASIGAPSNSGRFVPRLKASLPTVSADPAAFDGMMAAIALTLSTVVRVPAVAPAAEAVIDETPASSAIVSVGQQLLTSLTPTIAASPSSVDAALLLSACGRLIAATSAQAVYIDYESRDAAIAYRGQAVDIVSSLVEAADSAAIGVLASEATALRRSLRGLQSAIIVDINETIGRLPKVQIFEPGRPIDAWQLAHHIAGDTPANVEGVYLDIVSRNRPRHPAAIDKSRIEVRA